ncbi:MAG: sulfatase [Acidobacteria bacterium]|nr:sulfatase [Acidobacteriota bacterium]
MIAVDDLNDWVGCMDGHPNTSTPNIDRLAARGTLFTNAHCQAPICGPSRASIMSGLYPTTTGIYGQINDDKLRTASDPMRDVPFLFEYFRDNGYKTVGVGKLFHQHAPEGVLEESGGRAPGFGPSPEKHFKWDRPKTSTDWGPFPERDDQMPDFRSAAWAGERLAQKQDRPFFLAVGLLRPHVPWYVPPKWFGMHPAETLQTPPYLPSDFDDIPALAQKLAAVPMMPTADWALRNGEWRNIVQGYLASVSFADHYVGQVLAALDASPHADNTIVVLWGDHGYHVGEKNRFAKHSLWEEATHTPLIISAPGYGRGRRTARAAQLIDLYPTLVELCGLPRNARNEGRSLLPLLEDPQADWPHAALTTYGYGNHSVRDERYRYIVYEDGSQELYDHVNDPNEWRNLAADPSQAANIRRLRAFLPKAEAPWSPAAPYDYNEYLNDAFERHKRRP